MSVLWYCIAVLLVSAIPFQKVFAWCSHYLRRVQSGLHTPKETVSFCWAPVLSVLATVLTFLKGVLVLALTTYWFPEPLFFMVAIVLMVVGHYASLSLDFGGHADVVYVILGALLFFHWGLALVALSVLCVTMLLADDFRIASVLTALVSLWVSFVWDMASPLALLVLLGVWMLLMLLEGKFEKPLQSVRHFREPSVSPWLVL